MSLINLSRTSCKSCYKCVNSCAVKAIKMISEQAETVENRCINCGHCLVICPQNARSIKNDVELIKEALRSKRKIIASIAPSFPAAYDIKESGQLVTALKQLGFYAVEETAEGAQAVLDYYKRYISEGSLDNIITTSCPSVNYIVQIYYPSLIKYLLPVDSPMVAHAKIIRQRYGTDSYIVFIGPCIAKKKEAEDFHKIGLIDAVITFNELYEWLSEENISLLKLEPSEFGSEVYKGGSSFPIVGSIVDFAMKDSRNVKYEAIKIDGTSECMDIFKSMETGEITGVCVEANVCRGGCIGGPGISNNENSFFNKRKRVKQYIESKKCEPEKKDIEPFISKINLMRQFDNLEIVKKLASEDDIKEILKKMGKYTKEDELNCGGCGYNTCREKAQAVFEGMSESSLCLPYIRNKAESLKNLIFEASPNAIFIIDEDMNVLECNPKAEKVFLVNADTLKGKSVNMLIDDSDFKIVRDTREDIERKKVAYPAYGVVMMEDILYLENQSSVLIVMSDITAEEKNKKELARVKENTLDTAQVVIEKQMRVAQEIASLLGETTAETKVILTKLKNLAAEESSDIS